MAGKDVASSGGKPLLLHQGRHKTQSLALLAIVSLCFFAAQTIPNISFWSAGYQLQPTQDAPQFQWSQISPSKQLKYVPCYGGFQCARLDVPLNWNASDLENGPRAAIAIVKLPAKVPVTDERYGGAIVVNPGGPGESGIQEGLLSGRFIQTIIDSPSFSTVSDGRGKKSDEKFFDVIGFDPRGVNNTTPRLLCFPDAFNQQVWKRLSLDYGLLWDSESSLGLEWARAFALGGSCSQERNEKDMIRYVNTAQVVEDMVAIVERHGEWRQNQAQKIVKDTQGTTALQNHDILTRTAWKQGQEKLQYWGVSYGTALGQTFAAMHPDRVGRVVIDGVLDPTDYYSGSWLKNLQDSDKIIAKFSDYCFEAGPAKCPLYTGTSGRDVEARVEHIIFDLKTNPLPVPATGIGSLGGEVVTFGDIFLKSLNAMTNSYSAAESFFGVLLDVEKGNTTRLAAEKQSALAVAGLSRECINDGPFSDACLSESYVSLLGVTQMVACMDSAHDRQKNFTKADFTTYLTELRSQSKWYSTAWARNKIFCVGVTTEPAWRFEGPIAGETAHPLLIIGNSHDTVTPLPNARHVSTLFPGSVVLHQDSEGHCSHSNPSLCTARALRKYFHTGELPEPGTICKPEYYPFIGCVNKNEYGKCIEREAAEEEVWQALVGMT